MQTKVLFGFYIATKEGHIQSALSGVDVWKYEEDKRTKEQIKNNSNDFASFPVKP